MTLRRPHDCTRCGAAVGPGDRFGAVDVLDPDGRTKALLCRGCAADLRAFLDGGPEAGDGGSKSGDGGSTRTDGGSGEPGDRRNDPTRPDRRGFRSE